MATALPEDPTKKKNAFGDAAARAANPSAGFVAPAGILNRPAAPVLAPVNAGILNRPQMQEAAPVPGVAAGFRSSASTAPSTMPAAPTDASAGGSVAAGSPGALPDAPVRQTSFGDAAATGASVPAPLPMLTDGTPPTAALAPLRTSTAPAGPAAGGTSALRPEDTGAVFGVYPKPSSQFSSNTNDRALARGFVATGPGTFSPAPSLAPLDPLRLNAATDPRSATYEGATSAPRGFSAARESLDGSQAQVRAVDNNAANSAAIAAAPSQSAPAVGGAAPASGDVTRVANTYSGTNVAGGFSVNGAQGRGTFSELGGSGVSSADRIAQYQRDGQHLRDMAGIQREIDAQNGQAPGMTVFGTRPVRPSRTAMEQAGETARAGMREAGENRRAAASTAQLGFRNALDRDEFALKKDAAAFDSRSRSRIEAAQLKVQNAATPEARRAAAEELAALSGKANQDNFSAVEIGGGTEPIDPANPMLGVRTLPKTPVIFNKATGQIVTPPAAPAARPAIAEGSISTVNGKSARFTGGKWVPL